MNPLKNVRIKRFEETNILDNWLFKNSEKVEVFDIKVGFNQYGRIRDYAVMYREINKTTEDKN